jgi:oxygen-independent coproporphyrinogen III oxidase
MLQPNELMRIMAALHARFRITRATEIAIEIDPRSLTRAHIAALVDMGVHRASLGVQDFEPRVQEAIGRRQSIEQTARAADGLREAGIVHINLDLMTGCRSRPWPPSPTRRSARSSSAPTGSRCSATPTYLG